MDGRQLLWLACCAAALWGRAAGSPSEAPVPSIPTVLAGPSSNLTAAATGSHAEPSRDGPGDGAPSSPATAAAGLRTAGTSARPDQVPSRAPHGSAEEAAASTTSPAVTQSPNGTSAGTTAGTTAQITAGSAAGTVAGTTEGTKPPPSSSAAPSRPGTDRADRAEVPAGGGGDRSSQAIACHEVKDVREAEGTCLRLQETNTCKHFLDTKGSDLWRAICEESGRRVPSPCQIKLAKSEVDRDCLLLVLVGETDPATDVLQKSHWEKFGIKSLKRGSVRSHQDFSRKTLIALVTSGLLLAFLGLAGYFLLRRRSWSPVAERLGEDPYYLESDSQGNTMVTTASHEPAEPPEKANVNGGAQENGTGQAASPNGCSAQQHGEADTEM